MRTRSLIASLCFLAAATAPIGAARADMVAGWDFSQYFGANILSVDGATYTNTLDANYSDLDPTFGAGAESATFGTMYMDGSYGSTAVTAGTGTEPFVPTSGSLNSNLSAPALVDFDAHTVLDNEGQTFTNFLSMTASDAVDIVFSADLSTVADLGSDWVLTFGGQTFSGTSSVGIEFSTDGSAYTSYGSVMLDSLDKLYTVNLGTDASNLAFVRLSFSPSGVDQPVIDNLAISATLAPIPEPGTGLLLLGGLLGLRTVRRRLV